MRNRPVLSAFCKILVLNTLVQVISRIAEILLIILKHGMQESMIRSELLGVPYDLVITNALLLIAYPLFFLFSRRSLRAASGVFLFFIVVMGVLHQIILTYFLYQLIPLDTFLYQYSVRELFYTIATSGADFGIHLLILSFLVIFTILFHRLIQRKFLSEKAVNGCYLVSLLFIPVTLFFILYPAHLNKFAENKSFYFYTRSLAYFLNRNSELDYSSESALKFQKLYPHKSFHGAEFPLLHEFDTTNVLEPFFNRFDSAPNIVIIVVEGLNDDFIHPFRGIDLMPALDNLAGRSLYWSRCFSNGERSFAVMPSILGSLPYGEKGFSMLNILPRHLSLVSILHANRYFTSFFYGQGSWFHRKNIFFRHNDIDLIIDNSRFAGHYNRIIVGSDNFFWGYNDKDLFNQAFEVLDTIPRMPRLDIYFTGTSHSPYAIADKARYDLQFSGLLQKLGNNEDKDFFEMHKKYIQSILFVNDALEAFFRKYETRPDFHNTIFIVTGDHPMSEISVSNTLKRYHVPLILYSPGLKTSGKFTNTVCHLDIYETLLSFLSGYSVKVPSFSTALGSKLIGNASHSGRRIAFMNDNREVIDYLCNGYFLSAQKLYNVNEDLSLTLSKDKNIMKQLKDELGIFKKTSLYVSVNDKILPDSLYCKGLGYTLIASLPRVREVVGFDNEFYNLLPKIPVQNRTFYFDVAFDHSGKPDDGFSLVYQLSVKNDSNIYWRNTGVTDDPASFQAHIAIPGRHASDSLLYFQSFFWNRNLQHFGFKNLRYSIYTRQP